MTGLAAPSTQDPQGPAVPDGGPAAQGSRRRRRWPARVSRRTAALSALVVLALVALLVWRLSDGGPPALTARDVDAAVAEGIEQAREEDRNAPPDASVAYQTILPSMVTITTRRAGAGDAVGSGLGAGFVVNASGAVMTALHVVEGDRSSEVDTIVVRFADGTEANGQVVSRQPENDIAVLAVDRLPEVVVPAVLGGGVQVGDPVFPVGDPLGLRGTLTAGVVSATGRSVTTERGGTLSDLIQFDAAVNPGNSGGPLLDRAGRVVGVVTGLANPTDESYFVGVGFAVPIATAGGGAGGPQK